MNTTWTKGTIGGLARASAFWMLTAGPVAQAQEPAPDAPKAERPRTDAKPKTKPKAKAGTKSKSARARRDRPGFYRGRPIADVMSWQGAEWLFRETRIDEEQPEAMLDALEIAPGALVADVGAGAGYHSIRLARRVGEKGTVLAADVQPQMLQLLRENAQIAGVANIKPVLATQRDTKLPEGKVDLILMVDVYHECTDPDVLLAGFLKALRPGGRLVLVEFRGEDPEVPIKPEHKMTLKQVRLELEPQGFRFQRSLEFLPWQHVIIFEKPKSDEKPRAESKSKSESESESESETEPKPSAESTTP